MNRSSEKIQESIHNSTGESVKKLLKKKNIISPSIKNQIKITNGLWITPKRKLKTKKAIINFINKQREKFKIK